MTTRRTSFARYIGLTKGEGTKTSPPAAALAVLVAVVVCVVLWMLVF